MLKITLEINHVEKKLGCHKSMTRDYNHILKYGAAPLDVKRDMRVRRKSSAVYRGLSGKKGQ